MAQPAKNYMRLYVNGAPTDYLGPQIGTAEANSLLASQDDEELPIVVIPSRNRRDLFLPSEDTIIRKRAVDHLARFSRNLPEQEQMYQIQNTINDLRVHENAYKELDLTMAFGMQECIWLVLSFILPPLAIFLRHDDCNVHVAISVILIFFFWFPGVFHALWYCFCR
ncbi:unnamed protein product [Bursaphelenchus xylophilus]|uniref:(pine wood nematode) hypothetical protein n=1 Tax=Bursaphelenchus xylophilus TaxID=6326 RepID=A0A7I8X316_BURXY|nr:unnamed protein product [Bursaphelenchus xylophilus]CAG9131008.1 unnamed protein product [Bursaphelenchus xylophilus]